MHTLISTASGGELMLATIPYQRDNAVAYARRWALSRNPLFENYSGIGGDCTNFVSQSIYAGGCVMNYTPTFGWYYISPTDRAPAWTGVEFFYNFMTSNEEIGPYATEVREGDLLPGDVIQLGDETGDFYHTLMVVGEDNEDYLVAAHSNDSLDRPLSSYTYSQARFLRIEGIRIEIPDRYGRNCFRDFIAGRRI